MKCGVKKTSFFLLFVIVVYLNNRSDYEVGYCSLCPYGRVANDNSTDCNGCADGFYPSEVVDVEYDCLPCGRKHKPVCCSNAHRIVGSVGVWSGFSRRLFHIDDSACDHSGSHYVSVFLLWLHLCDVFVYATKEATSESAIRAIATIDGRIKTTTTNVFFFFFY